MKLSRWIMGIALLGSAGLVNTASASIDFVTQPAGLSSSSDSGAYNTWFRNNVGGGGSVGITTTYAHSGNGSMQFTGTDGNSKADIEYYFNPTPASGLPTLGNLTSFAYDWYRDSSSTNSNVQAPAIRLLIGDSTGHAIGALVFEPVYNGISPIPTNQWVTSTITGSTNVWLRQYGVGTDENYNRTLDQWISGQTDPGFATLSASDTILGISSGVGSGWDGSYSMAVDNIKVGFGGNETTYNFEAVQAVPEPSTLAIAGLGALGFLGYGLKRRVKAS